MIKMSVKQCVFIKQPPEAVFAYMSDLENLVDWSSCVIAVRKISPGAAQVGATVRSTMRFLGRWLDMKFEIVEYECSHSLTFKSISGVSPCLFCYQFELAEGGGTTVCVEAVIHHAEGILELEEEVVASAIRRQLEYDLLTLKDLLEARAPICRLAD